MKLRGIIILIGVIAAFVAALYLRGSYIVNLDMDTPTDEDNFQEETLIEDTEAIDEGEPLVDSGATDTAESVIDDPVVGKPSLDESDPRSIIARSYAVGTSLVREGCEGITQYSKYHRDPENPSVYWVGSLEGEGKAEDAETMRQLACQPQGIWLIGQTLEELKSKIRRTIDNSKGEGTIPLFVIYNVPSREKAEWLNVDSSEEYINNVKALSEAIGNDEATIILEPDALPMAYFYSNADRKKRFSELSNAVDLIRTYAPNSRIYIDAGHSKWRTVKETVSALKQSGVAGATGFSLNVSNFHPTEGEILYGLEISEKLDGKHFVIDTSRNGNGAPEADEWCNPFGRAIGHPPNDRVDHPMIDGFLWIKISGESDGDCNGGTPEGVFWLDYALDLVRNKK